MSDKKISLWDLEKHETKDTLDSHINGELTVVWRDWDNLIKDHPKMVYINSINPGEKKGPHLHKKRTTYFSCIRGKILLIAQEIDGTLREMILDSKKPQLACIPNGIAAALVNHDSNPATVSVLADIAWRPDDDEMENVSFEEYDWKIQKK
tara:strand:+ start:91 stop:543 length:453 start_codon:yes stop_codon:yes gene_type:complete